MRTLLCLLLLAACSVPATRFTPGSTSDGSLAPDDASNGGGDAAPTSAMLSASPSGDVGLGTVVIGETSAEATVTVSNDGDEASGMIEISLDDTASGFAIADDSCSTTSLAGHATCTFGLTFTPTSSAAVQTALHITADPGGDVMKLVFGTGIVQGQIDITDTSYTFPDQDLGATMATEVFTVSNTGQTQIGTPMPQISGDPSYKLLATTCNAPLDETDTCTVKVQFAPTSVGQKAGSLVVSAMPGGSDSATLSGTAMAHVAVTISGSGTVTSNPNGISCPDSCEADFTSSPVTLKASPGATAVFTGWTGDCSGTGDCSLTLDGAKHVTATFVAAAHIDITEGSYTFPDQGLGATMGTEMFTVSNTGQSPTGVPMVSTSGDFKVQSTDCTAALGPTDTCTVKVQFAPTSVGAKSGSLAVSATPGGSDTASLSGTAFAHVVVTVSGSGTVTSNPAGIACPGTCAADFTSSPVTLSASPGAAAVFAGWTGACSGTGSCLLTLDGAKSVDASFVAQGQIDITDTSYTFPDQGLGATMGTKVFTVGNTGQSPTGVPMVSTSGDFRVQSTTCTAALGPTDKCTVTVQFAPTSAGAKAGVLSVSASPGGSDTASLSGTAFAHVAVTIVGTGTVTSNPAGISCPNICAADFTSSSVTLAATPGAQQTFTGWSGGCSGTGGCSLTLDAAKSVTATFSPKKYAVNVSLTSGNTTGTNTITSSPAGISCTSTGCTGMFPYGSSVTLTAKPDATWGRFVSWPSGPCAGSTNPACTFTVPAATTTMTASFTWFATMTILANEGISGDSTVTTQVSSSDGTLVCSNTTTLAGTCLMHYGRNSSITFTYAGVPAGVGSTTWSQCPHKTSTTISTLQAAASGSCTPPDGFIGAADSESCTMSFTTAGDYTSRYDVACETTVINPPP